MTTFEEKSDWIIDYLEDSSGVSVVDQDFQEAYYKKFKVKRVIKMYGANPCPDAQKTLKKMYDAGEVRRARMSITGQLPGFPKWVWVYSL